MRIARLMVSRRPRQAALPGVSGPVRLDRRTKNLTKRLRAGDIAVIDHRDIDRTAGEALVRTGVAAVVNVAESISGRYPNLGPQIIVEAGIPLLDGVGEDLFGAVREEEILRLDGDILYSGERVVAKGSLLTPVAVQTALDDARAGLDLALEAFAANTMEYLRRERSLLVDGIGVPAIKTDLDGAHVLVVVRGYSYREDLATLGPYIRENRPVLVGVDGGADALLEAGYTPQLIVGDMDSVSDEALRCGAELVVHAYRDGRAPGGARIAELGLDAVEFPAAGTSEDIAMLLADELGASLIVAVGTHATLVEFLDKGRAGMASTFLTRLRLGGKLVDAKGVSRLYRSRISSRALLLLVGSALVTLIVVVASSPVGQVYLTILGAKWDAFASWVTGLF